MDFLDLYLRRAVMACVQMMENGIPMDSLMAFHYAVGLSLMGDRSVDGTPIPQITKDGLDALHATAHILQDEGLPLSRYATAQIANLHVAMDLALANWTVED